MKARWQQLRAQHWDSRAASERKLLGWGGAVLLPIVGYFLLWQPAHLALTKLHRSLPALRAEAQLLHVQTQEVAALQHRPVLAALDASALKTTVVESAVRHQLRDALNSLEPQPPNHLRVSCEAIAFAPLLAWLRNLEQEQHIRAESFAVTALPQSGMVKVVFTLTNGNGQ